MASSRSLKMLGRQFDVAAGAVEFKDVVAGRAGLRAKPKRTKQDQQKGAQKHAAIFLVRCLHAGDSARSRAPRKAANSGQAEGQCTAEESGVCKASRALSKTAAGEIACRQASFSQYAHRLLRHGTHGRLVVCITFSKLAVRPGVATDRSAQKWRSPDAPPPPQHASGRCRW